MKSILFSGLQNFVDFLLNKYIMAAFIFIVWLLFFDQYSIGNQIALSRTIQDISKEQQYFSEELQKTLQQQEELSNNLEKYAREKYFMKKPGEEIYLVR